MAKDYLAMYLEITTDMGKATHFIPIMHFAENVARLTQDIKDEAFYTNEVRLGMALERIKNQTPFHIAVLFVSTLPAMKTIMSNAALKEMRLMSADLKAILNPPVTAPVIGKPELFTVSIKMGMKNKSTPYPKDFVEMRTNFTTGQFVVQFSDVQVTETPLVINNNIFIALTFHHVTGQIFMNTGM